MKEILRSGPGLIFGIPTLGRPVPLDWALSLKSLNAPINFSTIFTIIRGKEVGEARNQIAEQAVREGAKYLFFLGDDVEVPPHTLRQLIFRMDQDDKIGVVGGIYCAKQTPTFPLVFRGVGNGSYWDWKVGEFFEVTGLGMDCTLIRVSMLEKIKKPWFKTVDEDTYLDAKNHAEVWTEDLYFCKKVLEETDYRVYCDSSIICNHHDVYGGKFYNLPSKSLPMRQKAKFTEKQCLIIGPDIPFNDENYDVTTFDDRDGVDYRGHYSQLPFEKETIDWVIVSKCGYDFQSNLEEWMRIVKPGGKLSINPQFDFMDKDQVIKYLESKFGGTITENGNFLELNKDGAA